MFVCLPESGSGVAVTITVCVTTCVWIEVTVSVTVLTSEEKKGGNERSGS